MNIRSRSVFTGTFSFPFFSRYIKHIPLKCMLLMSLKIEAEDHSDNAGSFVVIVITYHVSIEYKQETFHPPPVTIS